MISPGRLELVGGSTLGVEISDVTVDLVCRDTTGEVTLGHMLAPDDARTLARALMAAARAIEKG